MIASPCLGTCQIDRTAGLCLGCARTVEEVVGWRGASGADRQRTWAALPGRRARLGIDLHRLPWTAVEIREFVAATLRAGGGTWTFGEPDADAEFPAGDGEEPTIDREPTRIEAATRRGAIRFTLPDGLRALASSSTGRLILALPRDPEAWPRSTGLADLGPDREAIRPGDRAGRLYDLGLGDPAASVGLRTADPALIRALDRQLGRAWADVLGAIHHAAPDRVVRNALGRVEVFAPTAGPGHRQTSPGPGLPGSLVPCATFRPGPTPPAEADE